MFTDLLPGKETLSFWLLHYGSFAIFGVMALGIIALPVPEETLMVIAGIFMSKGQLNIPLTVLACYAGSMAGITMSYFLGRTAGTFFIKKYGRWVGISESKLHYAHNWFSRYGKWSLFFGYFIPGVRHLTGLTAGMTHLKYKQFALFAYLGAIIWVSTFLSVGYFLHSYWRCIFLTVEARLEQIILLLIFILLCYFFFHKMKKK
jgi:membrane protein DedA with SNARE-associated domain